MSGLHHHMPPPSTLLYQVTPWVPTDKITPITLQLPLLSIIQVGQLKSIPSSVLLSIITPVHSQRLLPRPFYWALGINNVSKKYSVEALKQKGYTLFLVF